MPHTSQNLAPASLPESPRGKTHHPAARPSHRRAFLSRAIFAACLLLLSAGLAHAQQTFEGHWEGYYFNGAGQKAHDSATITEKRDGSLVGTWGDVTISGKLTSNTTATLRGENPTHLYTITAFLKGDQLTFGYHAKVRDSATEYEGESRFRRK